MHADHISTGQGGVSLLKVPEVLWSGEEVTNQRVPGQKPHPGQCVPTPPFNLLLLFHLLPYPLFSSLTVSPVSIVHPPPYAQDGEDGA